LRNLLRVRFLAPAAFRWRLDLGNLCTFLFGSSRTYRVAPNETVAIIYLLIFVGLAEVDINNFSNQVTGMVVLLRWFVITVT
jgi:hypothetical protein